jgi:hypothetical protein
VHSRALSDVASRHSTGREVRLPSIRGRDRAQGLLDGFGPLERKHPRASGTSFSFNADSLSLKEARVDIRINSGEVNVVPFTP